MIAEYQHHSSLGRPKDRHSGWSDLLFLSFLTVGDYEIGGRMVCRYAHLFRSVRVFPSWDMRGR